MKMDMQALQVASGSSPVPADLRRKLEESWGVDLSAARIHSGPYVDAVLRLSGAAAAATGNDILVDSRLREESREWRRVVAHEAAHVVQQARGVAGAAAALSARASEATLERAAEAAARAALAGRRFTDLLAVRPEPVPVVQYFNAWEHTLLGSLPRNELMAVAANGPEGHTYMQQMSDAIGLFQYDATKVTEAAVHGKKANLEVLTLPGSGLLATYGEINAIAADYVASPDALAKLPTNTILPFLQQARQETFNRLNARLGAVTAAKFAGSITDYHGPDTWDPTADGREASDIDTFTKAQKLGFDHYYGLLARNACHFVPFSWHRWRAFHELARSQATAAHAASDATQKATLTTRAWMTQCYADHFLQDSFAAGHLINKTLIMQWYTEWLDESIIPVADWAIVKNVTWENQPNLWGAALYDPGATVPSNDPQTAEEHTTYAARLAATGVRAFGSFTADQAYTQYLDFLDSSVIQLSSNMVHNYFNENSLTVKSNAVASAYRIFGDESLLKSADAVQQIAIAMELSKSSITNILNTGAPAIDVKQILDRLPTQMPRPLDGKLMTLDVWHKGGFHDFCVKQIFSGVYAGLKAFIVEGWGPTMGIVSVDQAIVGSH
jgi:hypothetical protein